jgi:prepilin-type N-terminal cleavage/methylation domain-containing protein
MFSSFPDRSAPAGGRGGAFGAGRAHGFSLLELLISIVIFMIALIPIADMLSSGNRLAAAGHRLLEATLHGQTLLEAITQLEPREIPADGSTESLLLEGPSAAAPGGSGRWPELVTFYSRPTPFPMERQVRASKLPDGRTIISVHIEFERVPGEAATRHTILMQGLAVPRGWQ